MDTIKQILLVMHIIGGGTALVAGLVPMMATKGSQLHRIGGQVFTYAMWLAVVAAVPLAIMRSSLFLGAVGVFTSYLLYTGHRAVVRHSVHPTGPDRWVARLAILAGIFMVGFGLWLILSPGSSWGAGLILCVFGGLLGRMAREDVRVASDSSNAAWLLSHLARMGGAYIATLTAFLVTNVEVIHPLILWLGPTVIGMMVMGRVSAHWKIKIQSTEHPYRDRMNKALETNTIAGLQQDASPIIRG